MLYCIFGDIHGNLEALEAVLADAREQQADAYVCVGDIVGYGANPSECIAKVREVTDKTVAGNHDWAAVGRTDIEYFNIFAREAVLWTQNHLSEEQKTFLSRLPLTIELDRFTVVHSTPYRPELFDYIENAVAARLSFQALASPLASGTSLGVLG